MKTLTPPVLLTVSGNIPDDIHQQIADGIRPESDYLALARHLPADLLNYRAARQVTGVFGRLLERIGGPNLMLAWACFLQRRRYRVIFTDGEQVGIPLALLLKIAGGSDRPQHNMIVHILSVGKKMLFFDRLSIQNQIDIFFTYSSWQKSFIEQRWHVPPERVVFTPFMVNTDFFTPERETQPNPYRARFGDPLICAVGLEYRDYPTLIEAVRGLPVQLVIAAASPWSKRPNTTAGQDLPQNVTVTRFRPCELRDVYAASRFLVMPLYNVNFQAGVTAMLEAMAMGKAIICTHTPGQTDVVVDGQTGLYVAPGDIQGFRSAIQLFLNEPREVQHMGQNGRQRVLDSMSLDCYVERLGQYCSPRQGN